MRRSRRQRGAGQFALNLASMIDVTFLLLIYFIVTTILARPEDKLSPMLQTQRDPQSGAAADFEPQIVRVISSGGRTVYRIGSLTLTSREQLAGALEGLPKSAGIFIQVHDRVSVGAAVTAIQLARDAGFEQVTYVPAS